MTHVFQWLGPSRNTFHNLKGGFLLRPAAWVIGLGSTGAFLSWAESVDPAMNGWLPVVLFPSRQDPQMAQIILSTVATSIMTVVSIVFAVLLMTLTLTSMQFSPRILVNFVKDKVTQHTLGIFLGTFAYCLAALPAAHSLPYASTPVLTVFGAMLLALSSVGWLLYFIHHISQAISVSHIVDRLAGETCDMVRQMSTLDTLTGSGAPGRNTPGESRESAWTDLLAHRTGYIRYVDLMAIKKLATYHGVTLQLLRRVGDFVQEGLPLARLSTSDRRLAAAMRDVFLFCIEIGPTRTLQQDIEFGILQIVDIALKAISPAVNDPSTAVTCVDQLSRVLRQVLQREVGASVLRDGQGEVRVWSPAPDLERLLDAAFTQIRLYAKADFAVSMRLLKVLGELIAMASESAHVSLLRLHGMRVREGCRTHMARSEWQLLDERWQQTCASRSTLQATSTHHRWNERSD